MADDKQSDGEIVRRGLASRHVFLDTESYRSFGFNLESAPLKALRQHIAEHRLILHVTEITFSEIERHLLGEAAEFARRLADTKRTMEQWHSRAPFEPKLEVPRIDDATLGKAAFARLHFELSYRWDTQTHKALGIASNVIFDAYFKRRPPFDEENRKEFPDAFVIQVLADWCGQTGNTMYVVTRDKAMQRAAEASGVLTPINSLQELLQLATSAESPETLQRVKKILSKQKQFQKIEDYLRDNIGGLGIVYSGELPDGEAYEAIMTNTPETERISVLSASKETISALVTLKMPVVVNIQYEDRSEAIYDKEDGIWFGAEREEAEIEDVITIQVSLEIDVKSEELADITILTRDVYISEAYDYEK